MFFRSMVSSASSTFVMRQTTSKLIKLTSLLRAKQSQPHIEGADACVKNVCDLIKTIKYKECQGWIIQQPR